jgi:hypothetical protein
MKFYHIEASGISAAVELIIHDPKFPDLNLAAATNGDEKDQPN